jgi:phosphohistidine swiveling domain-containing protein
MLSSRGRAPRLASGGLWLTDAAAAQPERAGNKAAALARALHAGLPVLPGFVLPPHVAATLVAGLEPDLEADVYELWAALSERGTRPLVVRSSSSTEDSAGASMAGLFTSVLRVEGWDAFRDAVTRVVESAKVVAIADRPAKARSMAVLVQLHLEAVSGGVLFGADPVTARLDRLIVSAVDGGPERLVQGEVTGSRYVLTRRGQVIECDASEGGAEVGERHLAQLARLAARAAKLFGGPQDIEWAVDAESRLWLLQSRPITTLGRGGRAQGPVLGPGPVAETFPDPLAPLEADLWVEPVRRAVTEALVLAGTTPRRRLRRSPVVTTVNGRVVVDLELLGISGQRKRWIARLDPRPSMRRLRAAWRVGRLRAVLPALAQDLLEQADAELAQVPALDELNDGQLVELLDHSRQALVAVHGHEVLAGLLLSPTTPAVTAASTALRTLADGRGSGLDDAEIVARDPVVLALVPPAIGPAAPLPDAGLPDTGPLPQTVTAPAAAAPNPPADDQHMAVLREALRLRARWLHELGARAAWELAVRLSTRDLLPRPESIRALTLDELAVVVRAGEVPTDLTERTWMRSAPALPAAFRLTNEGAVVPVTASPPPRGQAGQAAGGGRGTGRVSAPGTAPEPGEVLVVHTLDPGLAPWLPRLAGLVAETGSVLSHLAILAREFGVPAVVGVPDAVARFPAGSTVAVDGATGEVSTVSEADRGVA